MLSAMLVGAALAQPVRDATAESLLVSRAAAAVTQTAAASAPAAWSSRAWSMPVHVVELPVERPFGPPTRKYRALTWRNDALSQALGCSF